MEVKVKKTQKRKKGRKLLRAAHNMQTGKYTRQKVRTTANKRKRIAWQKQIRETKLANLKKTA